MKNPKAGITTRFSCFCNERFTAFDAHRIILAAMAAGKVRCPWHHDMPGSDRSAVAAQSFSTVRLRVTLSRNAWVLCRLRPHQGKSSRVPRLDPGGVGLSSRASPKDFVAVRWQRGRCSQTPPLRHSLGRDHILHLHKPVISHDYMGFDTGSGVAA